ncbi:MAG: ABC transporter permease [Clostridiaceae bacterium]|nr:ABC transporter permease [Clostridiaceae bacterium]
MKMLLKIAYHNILRHKGRTFRSALTIGVALMFFIAMDSIMTGMDRSAIDNIIELSTAAISLHTKEYMKDREAFPLKFGIKTLDNIISTISKDPKVTATTPRTLFLGQLSNYTDVIPVQGIVVEPSTDTLVFSLNKYLEGFWFSKESNREIILGKNLAKELGVSVGNSITLYALTKYDSRNADEFKVVGILNTTDPNLNKNAALISFESADDFLDLEGLKTQINIAVTRNSDLNIYLKLVNAIKSNITKDYDDIHAETFYDQSATFLQVSKQKKSFGFIFMGVILLIASIGIFNTVLMSVYERIREIGVLRAHGMTPKEITGLFLLEGLITGIVGSIVGVILGISINCYTIYVGLPLEKIAGDVDTSGIPIWGTMYGQWNPESILFAFLFGIIVATLASLIPSGKAGKMQVSQALRFV